MSVWQTVAVTNSSLNTSEGALVSVSVHVEPRHLEILLDALAQVNFPINPQIYHEASIQYAYPDGRSETEPATIVEFPAYERHLGEVRAVLAAYNFPAGCLHVAGMLDEIHSDTRTEPGAAGAGYVSRTIRKHPVVKAAAH